MSFFSNLKYSFCDIFDKVRMCKWRFILCAVISVIGFTLGIVFFNLSDCGWWYYNRCAYAIKLLEGGFGVLVSFVVIYAIIYLAYILCNMTRPTHYVPLLVNLIFCIYCGATIAAICVQSVLLGILYAIIVGLGWLITMCFACFVSICEPPICRTFCESTQDLKQLLFVLIIGLIYEIVALFVILKILTMLI